MYTTLEDLIDTYGEPMLVNLTDRDTVQTGAVRAETVDKAIADAAAMIDGYLAARYVLPLSVVPPLVQKLARDLTIFSLHIYDAPENIKAAQKMALSQLRDISDGKIRLQAEGIPTATTGTSGARVTDRARPMTHESLKGY